MRVLVAGATSTLGRVTVRELTARGHDVLALSRSAERAEALAAHGAQPVVADALDREALDRAVERARPDAVVSLLITLPRNGPVRYGDFRQTRQLWDVGVPNLLAAASAGGVGRIVAESVLFAYGYCDHGDRRLSERDVPWTSGNRQQRKILGSLHAMEARVVEAGGSVLRYGVFRGDGVPSERYLRRLMARRVPVLPGGGRSVLSFVQIDDAARATADALEPTEPPELLNVCDDEPARFADYARALARREELPAPVAVPAGLVRPVMPYTALILGRVGIAMSNSRARAELGWAPRSGPVA